MGPVGWAIPLNVGARPAEDQIRAIRALCLQNKAEQIGAAADNIVLSEIAENHIIAAAALNVVVTIAGSLDRGKRVQDSIFAICSGVVCLAGRVDEID